MNADLNFRYFIIRGKFQIFVGSEQFCYDKWLDVPWKRTMYRILAAPSWHWHWLWHYWHCTDIRVDTIQSKCWIPVEQRDADERLPKSFNHSRGTIIDNTRSPFCEWRLGEVREGKSDRLESRGRFDCGIAGRAYWQSVVGDGWVYTFC